MGPSGCGKTTLLNMLAARPTGAQKVEGAVLVDGAPPPSRAAFGRMTCFVEQDDALGGRPDGARDAALCVAAGQHQVSAYLLGS